MKKLVAVIEQTVRKEVSVGDDVPVGAFSLDALNVVNALAAENHSTIIRQRFLSAEVIEVSGNG